MKRLQSSMFAAVACALAVPATAAASEPLIAGLPGL